MATTITQLVQLEEEEEPRRGCAEDEDVLPSDAQPSARAIRRRFARPHRRPVLFGLPPSLDVARDSNSTPTAEQGDNLAVGDADLQGRRGGVGEERRIEVRFPCFRLIQLRETQICRGGGEESTRERGDI
jgi:hypothetical protein